MQVYFVASMDAGCIESEDRGWDGASLHIASANGRRRVRLPWESTGKKGFAQGRLRQTWHPTSGSKESHVTLEIEI